MAGLSGAPGMPSVLALVRPGGLSCGQTACRRLLFLRLWLLTRGCPLGGVWSTLSKPISPVSSLKVVRRPPDSQAVIRRHPVGGSDREQV